MRVLLERLGVRVVTASSGCPVEGLAVRHEQTVVVRASGYAPRDEFTLAHELLELHLPRELLELPRARKEALVDYGAAALLLPRAAFAADAHASGLDVPALRRRWRGASWAVVARRLVDVGAAGSAASWQGRQVAWRHGRPEHPSERVAVAQALRRGRAQLGPAMAWRIRGRAGESAVAVARG